MNYLEMNCTVDSSFRVLPDEHSGHGPLRSHTNYMLCSRLDAGNHGPGTWAEKKHVFLGQHSDCISPASKCLE